MTERILVIEDDPSILRGLQLNLTMEGYLVRSASDGAEGLAKARSERPDLLIVDLMLPSLSGLEIVEAIRRDDPDLPILILSAKGQDIDKVAGLSLGADDYVVKPFSLKELLARIDAALRRRRARGETGQGNTLYRAGLAEVDVRSRRVSREGKAVEVTAKEFDLLVHFIRHADAIYNRDQLLNAVWGEGYLGTSRTVDNFVARLRAVVEEDPERPRYLETVRGVGYRFNSKPG